MTLPLVNEHTTALHQSLHDYNRSLELDHPVHEERFQTTRLYRGTKPWKNPHQTLLPAHLLQLAGENVRLTLSFLIELVYE